MEEEKKYQITKKGIAAVVCLCIVFSAVFGFGGAYGAYYLKERSELRNGSTLSGKDAPAYDIKKATGSTLGVQEIVKRNENAVVEIRTETVATDSWMMQYIKEGAGSGVIISEDGYIMTNNHVIENASKITVRLKNGKEYHAEIIGRDEDSDIAVVKIREKGLTPVTYGDSSSLEVGQLAVAIGNPLGRLGGTATAGIISATGREITINGKDMTLLQTDASINPGNSGGGLFDHEGNLIGIVVAKSTGSDVEGLGFAIPVNTARKVAGEIMDHGYVRGRAEAGMSFIDLTSVKDAFFYGVGSTGIYIKDVYGSEAKNSGFRSGDRIIKIGDKEITSAKDLKDEFRKYKAGDTVNIIVARGDQELRLALVMGEKKN